MGTKITDEQIKQAYETNEDFRNYVDKFYSGLRRSADSTMKEEIIKEVYKMYFDVRGE